MVGMHASFIWDIPITRDSQPPYSEQEVRALVESMKAAGLEVSVPVDAQYAWEFDCKLPHLSVYCQLGLIEDPQLNWLLSFYPWRGLVNWLWGRWWEDEQNWLVDVADGVLRKNSQISGLRWYTCDQWMKAGGRVEE
jgi:hypothetical protein